MIKRFVEDMIHMTEGEKLITYWPLWMGVVAIAGAVCWSLRSRR